MAREAILRDTKNKTSTRYTCATTTGIAKGCFLKLSADKTAAASTGTADIFVGFAHADVNKSSDTNFNTETSVTADKGGVYELVASGSITKGDMLQTAVPGNYVMTIPEVATTGTSFNLTSVLQRIVGMALEDGDADETINVQVVC